MEQSRDKIIKKEQDLIKKLETMDVNEGFNIKFKESGEEFVIGVRCRNVMDIDCIFAGGYSIMKDRIARNTRIIILIDKAIEDKQNSKIDIEYWENLLFDMIDKRELTPVEAYAIDKILGLNLFYYK